MTDKKQKNIIWFNEISKEDVSLVGGKNASLGEMICHLTPKGINIPDGFATTSLAYYDFLKKTGLKNKIEEILKDIDFSNIKMLGEKGRTIRKLIIRSELPSELKDEIIRFYRLLSQKYNERETDVAIRSSATAEDLPNASFAGQQESFLNVRGDNEVLEAVKKCFASLFTDRAIAYREEMKFDHLKIGLSVGIQKMVRSDLGSSGVMFSCDTESGFGDVILINASYGLGENIVKGKVDPDQYYVFETTLKQGFTPILEKKLGTKSVKLIYNPKSKKNPTKNISVSKKERENFVLTNEEILTLAKWSLIIEEHYKRSMDMEWAKDGRDGKLYIVQARPETVQSRRNINVLEEYLLDKSKIKNQKLKVLVEGLSVGNKIGQGKIKKIMNVKDINKFKKGEILLTDMTDPDWVPAMKIASAIITDSGGRTCHAAIVSRELGVPCVVGTGNATRILKSGDYVTVSCAEGEIGKVYKGIFPFEIRKTDISKIKKPPVKIMMNLGEPDQAFKLSFLPNDGIGLAREEFIIANKIKVHPLALLNYEKLPRSIKNKINKITTGYSNKREFFIEKLLESIGKIAAAFYPKEVIVRFSDFKTNEYRNLIGGELYEQKEENPMLGFRGACRYLNERFQPAFEMECEAIKKVRDIFGLKNVSVMVPFCRTIKEGEAIRNLIKGFGLIDIKVYVMCEIPSNVILADKFLEIFDGMSIGSNDLTQLILGLDRDNAEISFIGDERDMAVKEMVKRVIGICKEKKKYCGICGQAPSDFLEFAEFLIKEGIESISLNPDKIIKTILKLS